MVENGWTWLKMTGMCGNVWKWQDMSRTAGNGPNWLDMDGYGWKWIAMARNG